VVAGLAHFVETSKYVRIVPPVLGHAQLLVC